ncbi:ATP-dependent helicase HrpA [Kutzneria kofuensis]|uniref:RNA helicase n=2 Tax=Kutzneria kofuensis TaxID=103725 RepID=A0A7W9KBD4_9PSEU|nr:ATP-dependent RNA helicase HrpA [Kutzneria kofuensis]MBB5889487.1 ATP-dependent helicase HrpA [Kutzneria kofuensis]
MTAAHIELPQLMLRDEHRLRRRIDGTRKIRDEAKRRAALARIDEEVLAAQAKLAARVAAVPRISYPEELPVSQRRQDILDVIRDHQVVIVAGETGSGKTTQLPKICLELGRGVRGVIGHTQPRRLAARTVAERVAEELHTELGKVVGYKVRFTDQVGDDTLVKLMTDGILLAEIQSDRLLSRYDTLIIDEAHERSLNIDFILGYVKQLLPRRPDLKVIITSATIDPERFSRHFGDAPIVEVSGRTYPVETRYRPVVDPEDPDADPDRDQVQAIADAVDELCAEGPGDILVFLSGEREIRDTADALSKQDLRNTEILPLYARLSVGEQHRVFQRHTGRRIVLATNVAETSLTVPGIKYVIDPGNARISRYSHRLKVQRLPIEPISQASANQRKGRCGRVSEGICIRLYSEEDFLSRPEFTDAEILRTNLASVILQMVAAGLGDIAAFPFIDPPDRRNINDGIGLLQELGALENGKLTTIGRRLSQLPVDPRLARMVVAAEENGCVREVMVIAAALSIQDPRERPTEQQEQAQQQHARFRDPDSDFISFLNLWNYLREQQKELSSNQFRKMCRAEFLNYLRVREWQDIYSQLRQVVKGQGVSVNGGEIDTKGIHLSLLAGLLSHLGMKDVITKGVPRKGPTEYLGARGAKFAIFPGSALSRQQPQWVMAAELVETSRLWARVVAKIEPEWAEKLGAHLVKRNYSEPHWEARQGAVIATEKVTLYGLPIVAARRVNYGRIDPEVSRELFIRHALVDGEWRTNHRFFHHNRQLLENVEKLEDRVRRRDIKVDDETLFDFYDKRIGAEVVSVRHFDTWWRKTRREQPDLLTFDPDMLVNDNAGGITEADYPDHWTQGGVQLPLTYRFEPGRRDDGVTVRVPLPVLGQVDGDGLAWQIPGLRLELVTSLIKSLPKQIRRNFVPAPTFAKAVVDRIGADDQHVLEAVERELRTLSGVTIPREAWQLDQVPEHLKTTFHVVDERDRTLAEGKDLAAIKEDLRATMRAALSAAPNDIERTGLTSWDFGTLPRTHRQAVTGYEVTTYPSLVDRGDHVDVKLLDSAAQQRAAMALGTRRLLLLQLPSPVKLIVRSLSNDAKLTLSRNPHGGVPALLNDCIATAVDKLVADGGGPAFDQAGFEKLLVRARAGLNETVLDVVNRVRRVLNAAQAVERQLAAAKFAPDASVADIRAQLRGLVHADFAAETGYQRLPDVERYLKAIERRLEKLPENPQRDVQRTEEIAEITAEYRALLDAVPPGEPVGEPLRNIGWMIQELRVSYFAQTLGTAYPVSEKRIYKAMDEL